MVSVMIAAYNAEKTVARCLDSVLHQTMQDFEVVVINDGSTDGTADILAEYARKDARIRVIQQDNAGISAVRNRAVRESRGEELTFLDADDLLAPEYLCRLHETMERIGASCVCCNHCIIRGEDRTLGYEETEMVMLTAEQALDHLLYHGIPDVAPWGKLYRRELLAQITYPEGLLFEDTYVIADILIKAGSIVYVPEPLYEYHIYDTSISRTCKDGHVWDFCVAVDHMVETVRGYLPDCEAGCVRRRAHAVLSTMWTLDPQKHKTEWKQAHAQLRRLALPVLKDPRATKRDKLGILAALPGQRFFRFVWGMYEKMR